MSFENDMVEGGFSDEMEYMDYLEQNNRNNELRDEPAMNELIMTYSITSDDAEVEIIVSKMPFDEVLIWEYNSLEIAFPTDLTVNWGDGTINNLTTHKYRKKGTYNVTIKATNLQLLVIDGWSVTSIKGIQCPNLKYLHTTGAISYGDDYITMNPIAYSKLDVSKCTKLVYLDCSSNELSELDISSCTNLKHLDCDFNKLTELDVSKCVSLNRLFCDFNKFTELDISKCIKLVYLNSGNNKLTELDVSTCVSLNRLNCDFNKFTELDVSKCTKLVYLNCGSNKLTELDISGCISLKTLWGYENKLNEDVLNKIYRDLPQTQEGRIYVNGNPSIGDRSIAGNKGWKFCSNHN